MLKEIIQYNPEINISAAEISKNDIVLVFSKGEPVGYVHYEHGQGYSLYVNFDVDLEADITLPGPYDTLDKLILDNPRLSFKLIE